MQVLRKMRIHIHGITSEAWKMPDWFAGVSPISGNSGVCSLSVRLYERPGAAGTSATNQVA